MKRTLEGLTILDFTQVAAGPACTMMLADRGAEVIKVESPAGDLGRQLGPPWQNGQSVIFMALNRNKRSIVLDLKSGQDLETARRLMARADVVVESFRPGVMQRLGLGYETARGLKSDLIYCSISAYGQHGAERHKPGVDGIVQAASGLMSVCGVPGGEPSKVQAPVIDMSTGILAAFAIQDALLHRAATGEGQWLDVSMYASAMQLQQTSLASYLSTGEVPEPCGSAAPYSAPNEAYPTSDGWIMVAAYHPQRWEAFCQLLGCPGLAADTRFTTSNERVLNRRALAEIVGPAMRRKTTRQWLELLESADIICAPVADYAAVTASAAFAQGRYAARFRHKEAGEVAVIGPYDVEAGGRRCAHGLMPSPGLGEHTQEILSDLAGSGFAGAAAPAGKGVPLP
ncbi:CoA transferase [Orrella sp. JC864]|uniref:CaiB/BaiF CoA transferase family protein n=1 Tax=Orrella sp. JC864 TaxID=3120298 RepID=UPI00300B111B